MQKNIRLRMLTGQMVLVENVSDYTQDANGITITCQEEVVKGTGDTQTKTSVTVRKWFNNAATITLAEEYK